MLCLTLASCGRTRRLAGTSLAVLLGVAFLAGTLVLGDTLRRNFDTLFTDVNAGHRRGRAQRHRPRSIGRRGASSAVPRRRRGRRRRRGGGRARRQRLRPAARGRRRGHRRQRSAQLARSWIDDPDLNPYRLAEGRAPDGDDEVVVNRGPPRTATWRSATRPPCSPPSRSRSRSSASPRSATRTSWAGVTFTAFDLEDAERHRQVARSGDVDLGAGPTRASRRRRWPSASARCCPTASRPHGRGPSPRGDRRHQRATSSTCSRRS